MDINNNFIPVSLKFYTESNSYNLTTVFNLDTTIINIEIRSHS